MAAARRQQADHAKFADALRFAARVVETRGGVTDADVDAVRTAGYGGAEIAEIIGHVALKCMRPLDMRPLDDSNQRDSNGHSDRSGESSISIVPPCL